ncbi:MAG: gamma-glutamyltransferase [Chloroflexi bacterium]|nr:gamma-glutamyltransferase [Chloroflexota bacterium]
MTKGIIAAGHPATAQAGADILGAGGNATDAAVAAAFSSFVAESTLVSPGGGGFALVYGPELRSPLIYDFFCSFPGLGRPAAEAIDFFPISVDFGPTRQIFHIGRGAVAVPGNLAGLCRLQQEQGRLPLAVVLQPAIDLCRRGVPLGEFGCYVGHLLQPIFSNEPEIARLFGAPGAFFSPGFLYRNPDLANALEALAKEGTRLIYDGDIATILLQDQRQHGGLITREDLASYEVIVRPALHFPYRQFELLTNPPPSRGGALIAFSLAMLSGFDIGTLNFGNPRHLGLLAEVMRQTNLARPAFESSGDADLFLSSDHLQRHSNDLARRLARHARPYPPDPPPPPAHNCTTHISVLDADGNFVSLTTTSGEMPGYVLGGTGIILNNVLGEADLHPQGFHQGTPGQRIGSMMAPTIVLEEGRPILALGSGGANRLRTAILQVIMNFCDFGLDLQTAVEAPRIHFEAGELQLEGGIKESTVASLWRWGYDIVRWQGQHMFFGGTHAVGLDARGLFLGAGDPRRAGAVQRLD